MASNAEEPSRVQKLLKFYNDVTKGQRAIVTPANARLFLEAIPYKKPASVCVEVLVSSPAGLEAVRSSVRADIRLEGIKTHTLPFLAFLSDPEVKLLAEGDLLMQLVDVIVQPATFWNALIKFYPFISSNKFFLNHLLPEDGLQPFAWLVHEVATLPAKFRTDLLEDVRAVVKDEGLLSAASPETRALGYKIAKAVQMRSVPAESVLTTESPGGRHDNDFADFRNIEIFPTSDEFLSKEQPFYRLASEAFGLGPAERAGVHLDNQFRLLREDMLAELREDFQTAMGKKKRRTTALTPIVQLQFTDNRALSKCLVALKSFNDLQFVVVDTPVFAYQPVLEGIKDIANLPLQEQLLEPEAEHPELENCPRMDAFVSKLRSLEMSDDSTVCIDDTTKLDQSQRDSLVNALTAALCIIQGPPGTGKSFIGSLIVNYFFKYTSQKFLVISYTNHALDQFLEDLQEVGIPNKEMVRLGSKSTSRTEPLLLANQEREYRRPRASWTAINALILNRYSMQAELEEAWDKYNQFQISFHSMMEYLEFCEDCERFYEAFSLPEEDSQWKKVGKKGRQLQPEYLYDRWINGQDAGFLADKVPDTTVWAILPAERRNLQSKWTKGMIAERVEAVQSAVEKLNNNQERLEKARNEKKVEILNRKRIIACTTTAAAMYNKLIRAARPEIVLVEEAGEILECHILTALTQTVKKLVLIGDHRQLRPKINNYELSVEKGLGFGLNRSLFERLILQRHPHTTLRKQHRMHPAISAFPRALTYPDLLDAPKAADRPAIDGICNRVIFVHHENPEVGVKELLDRRDPTTQSSKQNDFEADMILKIVAYISRLVNNQAAIKHLIEA